MNYANVYKIYNPENLGYSDGGIYMKWMMNGKSFTDMELKSHLTEIATKRKNNPYLNCKIICYGPIVESTMESWTAINLHSNTFYVAPEPEFKPEKIIPEPPRAEDTVPLHN